MRIVIDMQGAQSPGSRNRGIGRYTLSLVDAMVTSGRDHEFILVLNGLFPETVEPLRERFAPLVGAENIRVWVSPGPASNIDPANARRRDAAEAIRETFIASLRPDAILVTSLFEGLTEDAVTSVGRTRRMAPTAVILYDLIPYMQRNPYLSHPPVELWYERKLHQLRLSDLQLAISSAAKSDSEAWLGTPSGDVVNISAAADSIFFPDETHKDGFDAVRAKYGVTRGTVMYTGGIDLRKNIPALIEAFAKLPQPIRAKHQLVIVCSVQPNDIVELKNHSRRAGLEDDELVITGFVPEDDLIAFYRNCDLFVFPSWMEGFGLPALEAMQCGAPVIGSNASAIPEVIGREDALFDPFSTDSIAAKMSEVLNSPQFAAELRNHGVAHSAKFSWPKTAERALDAIERTVRDRRLSAPASLGGARPKLAFVSPLPPLKSGIANYSAELLPDLSLYYDIDLVSDQTELNAPALSATMSVIDYDTFLKRPARYDRVVYQIGNSAFHGKMFPALQRVPGVVVLHDFFLSGVSHYLEAAGHGGDFWADLYRQGGYPALVERARHDDVSKIFGLYPTNTAAFDNSRGVIVHSSHAHDLAKQWYGARSATSVWTIPHLRKVPHVPDRNAARARLGIDQDILLVCSFGFPARTKLSLESIEAYAMSDASKGKSRFIFAGSLEGTYQKEVESRVRELGLEDRISSTGWIDDKTYADYLAASDLVVQLRGETRGETSGAVLDAMAAGRCLIVNRSGSMAELPPSAVTMLTKDFDAIELAAAIDEHWRDPRGRAEQGERARRYIASDHNGRKVAAEYMHAIEAFYSMPSPPISAAVDAAAQLNAIGSPADATDFAKAVARTFVPPRWQSQLLVDVSAMINDRNHGDRERLRALLMSSFGRLRVEPVFRDGNGRLKYARKFALGLLPGTALSLHDDPIDVHAGDIMLSPEKSETATGADQVSFMLAGAKVVAEIDGVNAFGRVP